jgi:hypothetical protein
VCVCVRVCVSCGEMTNLCERLVRNVECATQSVYILCFIDAAVPRGFGVSSDVEEGVESEQVEVTYPLINVTSCNEVLSQIELRYWNLKNISVEPGQKLLMRCLNFCFILENFFA